MNQLRLCDVCHGHSMEHLRGSLTGCLRGCVSGDASGQLTLWPVNITLFFRLFEIAPELLNLFSFKDASNKDEGMRQHGLNVMESIDAAITLLGSKEMSELVDNLVELGIIHNMKHVQLDSFAVS